MAATKRSLRSPLSLLLLLLLAILTLLSARSAIPIGFGSTPAAARQPAAVNSTLLRLAAADPADPDLLREVDSLLDGNLPRGAHRSISSLWRRRHHHHHDLLPARIRLRLRNPQDYRIFPEFRRLLRDWIRRRRFDPTRSLSSLTPLPLPLPGGPHPRPPSCAVVGNSGILLGSDRGALIDSHDLVIRLNNARIAGFSRHVGSRTNLSFVNSNILHTCARRRPCSSSCHPYSPAVPTLAYICQPAHFLDLASCNDSSLAVTDPAFDLLCARIVKYYSLRRFVRSTGRPPEDWGKVRNVKAFHYSSGMQAVALAAGTCGRVGVFGFGKSAGAKHHYHTNQKAELDLHDYEAEYDFYRDLAERPEVIPFLKDSGFKVPPVVFYH